VVYIVVTVRCNNVAGDRNYKVNHRLPLYSLTAGQVDGLQVLVQRFRSGMTLFRYPPHLPPSFRNIIITLPGHGTVFLLHWFLERARNKNTSCTVKTHFVSTWYDQIHSVGLRNAFSYGWRILIKFIFGQLTRRAVGVGVVKYKRLKSDINRNKSSCLYAHYEGVWAGGCMAPLISTPGTTWRWVINFAPRPLCSCTLHLPGINPRFFGRPTVAWSQYRRRCSVLCDARTCTSIFYLMISMKHSLNTCRYWS